MNILLVEPDILLARTYTAALKNAGHKVKIAGNAQTAIHAADKQRPDLVLLELALVSHSGIEFLYEFRSYDDWQNIPVVAHTGVPPAEFGHNRELLEDHLGVVGYYYKPRTTLTQLITVVGQYAPVKTS